MPCLYILIHFRHISIKNEMLCLSTTWTHLMNRLKLWVTWFAFDEPAFSISFHSSEHCHWLSTPAHLFMEMALLKIANSVRMTKSNDHLSGWVLLELSAMWTLLISPFRNSLCSELPNSPSFSAFLPHWLCLPKSPSGVLFPLPSEMLISPEFCSGLTSRSTAPGMVVYVHAGDPPVWIMIATTLLPVARTQESQFYTISAPEGPKHTSDLTHPCRTHFLPHQPFCSSCGSWQMTPPGHPSEPGNHPYVRICLIHSPGIFVFVLLHHCNKMPSTTVRRLGRPRSSCQHSCHFVRTLSVAHSRPLLTGASHGGRGEGTLWSLFYKVPIPFVRVGPSWPKHLPKALPPNTIILGG